MLLNMTPSFKSPVRNHQRPPSMFEASILRQFMSDLHQTLRISSISYTNMIYHVKEDTILQVSKSGNINILQTASNCFQTASCLISRFQNIFLNMTPSYTSPVRKLGVKSIFQKSCFFGNLIISP